MNDDFKKIEMTYSKIGPYLGLGTQLAASVVLMFFLGKYLDEKFSLFPWLTISFSALGSFAGIYNFVKSVLNLNQKAKLDKKN